MKRGEGDTHFAKFALFDHGFDFFLLPDFDCRGVAYETPKVVDTQNPDRQQDSAVDNDIDRQEYDLRLCWTIITILLQLQVPKKNQLC